MEQYKKQQFPTLTTGNGKKYKRPPTLYHALQRLAHVNRENDYMVCKWYSRQMEDIKYMLLRDYYASLEQIIKEVEKQKQNG